jgi:hypothetical protein
LKESSARLCRKFIREGFTLDATTADKPPVMENLKNTGNNGFQACGGEYEIPQHCLETTENIGSL